MLLPKPTILRWSALALMLLLGRYAPALLHARPEAPRADRLAPQTRAPPPFVEPDPVELTPPLAAPPTPTAAPTPPPRRARLAVDPDDALAWGERFFRSGEYTRALPYLDWAAFYLRDKGADRANLLVAFVHYFFGEDLAARDSLSRVAERSYESIQLEGCLSAPFLRRYGTAARAIEGRTPSYALATDVDFVRTQPSNAKLLEHGALLERIRVEFLATFHLYRSSTQEPLVPHVFIFRSTREFREFTASIMGPDRGEAGYYMPALRTIVIDGSSGDLREVIFHEAFHEFLAEYARGIPTWANEGMAEYFGACPSEAGWPALDVKLGAPREEYEVLRAVLSPFARRPPTPLRQLVRLSYHEFHAYDAAHYAESWAFVHFLLHGFPTGRQMITNYFDAFARGLGREEAERAAFGGVTWEALEDEWRRYVDRILADDAASEADWHFRLPEGEGR